jgi:hypothetical protein
MKKVAAERERASAKEAAAAVARLADGASGSADQPAPNQPAASAGANPSDEQQEADGSPSSPAADNPELSAYERARLENLEKNRLMMEQLGLVKVRSAWIAAAKRPHPAPPTPLLQKARSALGARRAKLPQGASPSYVAERHAQRALTCHRARVPRCPAIRA